MPSDRPAQRLRDIIENIDDACEFIRSCADSEAMKRDRRTLRAVERCFQIISEAASKLGDEAERYCPDIPWPDVRGMGNHLRHEYEGVDAQILWKTVRSDLPPLRAACVEALRAHFGDKG